MKLSLSVLLNHVPSPLNFHSRSPIIKLLTWDKFFKVRCKDPKLLLKSFINAVPTKKNPLSSDAWNALKYFVPCACFYIPNTLKMSRFSQKMKSFKKLINWFLLIKKPLIIMIRLLAQTKSSFKSYCLIKMEKFILIKFKKLLWLLLKILQTNLTNKNWLIYKINIKKLNT
jgi:hypothetical protein